jgi:hypothetical protein
MHRLFSEELEKYEVKPDLTEAIKIELESTYHELNKDSVEKEVILKARIIELTKDIETLEEKHFIKEEMPKETYERFRVKYTKEFDKIRKEIATCGISISNLKEMINEAVILCRNLRQLWQDGGIAFKEGLQNLLFPSGLVYDKKNGAFRTSEINFIITQIARHTGDLCKMKKGLSSLFEPKSPSAVWTGQKPLYINLTLLNLNVLIINYLILFRLK